MLLSCFSKSCDLISKITLSLIPVKFLFCQCDFPDSMGSLQFQVNCRLNNVYGNTTGCLFIVFFIKGRAGS